MVMYGWTVCQLMVNHLVVAGLPAKNAGQEHKSSSA